MNLLFFYFLFFGLALGLLASAARHLFRKRHQKVSGCILTKIKWLSGLTARTQARKAPAFASCGIHAMDFGTSAPKI
jgi:hypothetical protein